MYVLNRSQIRISSKIEKINSSEYFDHPKFFKIENSTSNKDTPIKYENKKLSAVTTHVRCTYSTEFRFIYIQKLKKLIRQNTSIIRNFSKLRILHQI
jgi:cobyrinic acid a,c-diamide synthase